MQYFTIISGIASILGFILTVTNIFPSHAKVRNYVTIFVIGTFIGSFIGSIKNININFPESPISAGILLFYILSLIGLFFLVIAAIFTEEKEKREDFLSVAGMGFGTLVFVGMLILIGIGLGFTMSNVVSDVPLDDILTIAEINVSKGNLDTAIKELDLFARSCPSDDSRKAAALKRIKELKNQQSKLITK